MADSHDHYGDGLHTSRFQVFDCVVEDFKRLGTLEVLEWSLVEISIRISVNSTFVYSNNISETCVWIFGGK